MPTYKRRYKVYNFTNYDPILDRLVFLFEASRIKPLQWAEKSDVAPATVYAILATAKRRNRAPARRTVTFPTLMRLTIGLGLALEDLQEDAATKPRRAYLRVV